MDKLIIKGAKALCRIGVSKKERSRKQRIIVDVEIGFDAGKAVHADSIKDTIDYLDVYGLIGKVAGKKKYTLIETLADSIAGNILADFNANSVCVRVKKPSAFPKNKAEYAAVEITRHNG